MTAIGRALMAPTPADPRRALHGLAPIVVQDIFRALRRLNTQEGLSILVAEQNSAIALTYADRAVILENGRTVLEGDARELKARGDVRAFLSRPEGGPDRPCGPLIPSIETTQGAMP